MILLAKRILLFFSLLIFGATTISASAYDHRVIHGDSVLERSAKLNFDEFDDLIKSAIDLYTQKKYDEALAICAQAASKRPADFRPSYLTGVIYAAQWKMKSASEAFAKAISLQPGNKRLYYLKASADRNRNAAEESVIAARKAIELDPSYADAYEILGESLAMGDKDNPGAMEAYRKAIKFKPDLFSAYKELGMHLSISKDPKDVKEAEEVYRKAMELDPQKMACRFDLGRLLVKQDRLAEARTVWDGRKSDKDNTFPNFITLLERAEKLQQAKDALAQKPNDPQAILQMGLMVMEGESWVTDSRQKQAAVYFKKALEIKPDFVEAEYALCKAYIQLPDWDKDKNSNIEKELAKLRKMDGKLADEIVAYRKTYSGGLRTSAGNPVDQ